MRLAAVVVVVALPVAQEKGLGRVVLVVVPLVGQLVVIKVMVARAVEVVVVVLVVRLRSSWALEEHLLMTP